MSFPPHLPSPSCNVASHRKWQRVKILLAAAVFGLMAGVSGAAIMLGWIWPGWGGGDDWMVSRVNNSWLNRTQLEERVRLEMTDRVASVYSSISSVRGVNYFSTDDKIGEAAVVTSDGWLVMNHVGNISGYKNWQVLFDDRAYKISEVLSDNNAEVVYIKLANIADREGAQFKVISFESNLAHIGDEVYVLQNGGWQYAVVQQVLSRAGSLPHLDSAPATRYTLNIKTNAGEMVIDKSGKMIGMVLSDGSVLPARYIERVLTSVLEKKSVVYPTFGLEGWFSSEQPVLVSSTAVNGFAVTKGVGDIKAGDVITEINGQIVDEDNLWYNLSAATTAKVKVSRASADKILEFEIKKKN